jgi:hypothetical protein
MTSLTRDGIERAGPSGRPEQEVGMQGNALAGAPSGTRRVAIAAIFAFVLAAALFAVPRAQAVAPILDSVDLPLYEDHPTFHWRLPTGDKGQIWSDHVVVANRSDVHPKWVPCRPPDPDDPGKLCRDSFWREFYGTNWVSFNVLGRTATSFTDLHEYKPGTYFVHIAGHDPACNVVIECANEYSNILSFDVVARPPGGGGGTGGDKVAPLQTLSFKGVQDIDKLFVTARVSETGTVKATGTVSTRGAAKVYRFKSVKRSVAANVKTKMRLKLRKKQLRAVKRTIKKRRSLKAKITVSATDKSGNTRRQKLTIRLVN